MGKMLRALDRLVIVTLSRLQGHSITKIVKTMRMPQSLGVGGRANPGEFVSFREARVKFPGNE